MQTRRVLELAAVALAVGLLYWAYPQASAQSAQSGPAVRVAPLLDELGLNTG